MPRVVCPRCGAHIDVSARRRGKTISCGCCLAPFTVPVRGPLGGRAAWVVGVVAAALCALAAWVAWR